MDYPLTKSLAVVTLGYSAWVATHPETLRRQLADPVEWQVPAERLTRTWAGRDVPGAVLTLLGGSTGARVGALLRVAGDLTDASVLGPTVDPAVRPKVLAVTGGYAVLNALALLVDERRRRA